MAFREKVILFSNPGALSAGQFDQLVTQIKEVDMTKVHAEIAEREAAEGGAAGA